MPCALDGIRQTSRAAIAARPVVGPDGQQSGQLALAPGVGLDRDLGVAREVGEPAFEVVDQRQVARRGVRRGKRVDVRETRQAHRLHLGGRVELHGARAQGDHAAVEGEVPVRQPAQVAQHGRLRVVLREHGVAQDGPPAHQRLGQRRRRPPSTPFSAIRAEGAQDHRHVRCGRRLAARDADAVVVDEAEQHALGVCTVHDPGRVSGRPHDDGVEELLVLELESRVAQTRRQLDRPAVHAARDVAEALGAVVHGVHGGDHGQEDLRRADVRGGLLTTDVLLTRLERQPVGGAILGVERQSHEAAREIAFEPGLDRHEGGVRTAVPQGDAEALGRSDDDIGPPVARWREQRQRQEVRRRGHHGATQVRLLGEGAEVTDRPRAAGILLDDPEELAFGQPAPQVDHVHVDPERLESCLEDGDGLREAVGVHDDAVRVDGGPAAHERDGLRDCGALVEQ